MQSASSHRSELRLKRRARRIYHRARGWRWGSSAPFSGGLGDACAAGLDDSELGRIFLAHSGRLAHKWTQYFPAYSGQLAPFRQGFPLAGGCCRQLRFLEIGISHGGSLQLWREYFGPDAQICGIDVDPRCAQFDDATSMVRIGSQADPEFLRSVVAEMGGVDIVIDDGSHIASHQRASFEALFPLLSNGGVYVVEDVHTSYWGNFGGGYRRPGTFIEVVKEMIDDMHDWYHQKGRASVPETYGVSGIAVFDSLVFIHKGDAKRPMAVRIGTASF